jgi:hypothetical protein
VGKQDDDVPESVGRQAQMNEDFVFERLPSVFLHCSQHFEDQQNPNKVNNFGFFGRILNFLAFYFSGLFVSQTFTSLVENDFKSELTIIYYLAILSES